MKIIILLLWIGTSLFGRECWIQVMSISKDTTVPSLFMERVKKSALPYKTIEKEGNTKIWLGSFATTGDARKVLPNVRCQIAADAFVIYDEPVGPTVEVVPESMAVIAAGHKISNVTAEIKTAPKEEMQPEVKVEEESVLEAKPCICICDKKAFKKAEIGAALDFYRNSPHYQFSASDN